MSIKIQIAERLRKLPPYLFVDIDRQKRKAKKEGRDVIDLGIGDPDAPTPGFIINALSKAAKDPCNHHYALDSGMQELRETMAAWYRERFNVSLDPDSEILPLIGSKEGIAHIPLAFINPGDAALVPDPCYPPYRSGVMFAGGEVCSMPLKEENGYLPRLDSIDSGILHRVKIMFLNYPNNPTGAVCGKEFYKKVIDFASKNNIIVCSDAAYTEIAYDGYKPLSFLEVEGAKDVGVEFHSLSKTYNMTGWRIGMACGNSSIIAALAKVKANVDSGIFNAVQRAGIAALNGSKDDLEKRKMVYQKRRDVLVNGLNSIGWQVEKPKAAFYVWAKTLRGLDSMGMCRLLLTDANIVTTPGSGFGRYGEGYVRMALTVDKNRLKEAVKRLKKIVHP